MAQKKLREKRRRSSVFDSAVSSKRFLDSSQVDLQEILKTPVNQLNLTLKGSRVESCISEFFRELDAFGIELRPRFYLSDGYGTCEGTANIGVAFWDVDKTLSVIGLRYLGELNKLWDIRMVLRHELGHAFCYSYKLYRLKEFRKIFKVRGHFFNTYPLHDRYKRDPWSRDYVNPCGDHYAQKHPDDDFAETFATLLDPRTHWRREYRNWKGAMRKLLYVESLIKKWGRRPVLVKNDPRKIYGPIEEISQTVQEFFAAKRAQRN